MTAQLTLGYQPTSGAEFSGDGLYRYVLWRAWAPGPHALFCMFNPSVASAVDNDLTVTKCCGFARRLGCGSARIVNRHAFVATDPDDLRAAADPIGPRNFDAIREELQRPGLGVFVCAWGSSKGVDSTIEQVLRLARDVGVRPMCLGTTKSGHPRHPSRLGYATPLVPFAPLQQLADRKDSPCPP